MKGCIAKDTAGDYFLVPQRGAKVRLASSGDVSAHVNQQVKLSGAFVDAERPAPSIEAGTNDPPSSKNRGTVREFRVVRVDVLASSCAAPSQRTK